MLATELLFVYVYCLVDDAIKAGALLIPRRPGPAPDCTDADLTENCNSPNAPKTPPPGRAGGRRHLDCELARAPVTPWPR